MDIFDDMGAVPRQKNCPVVTSLFNAASRNQLEKLNDIICKNPQVDYTESVNSFNCFHVAAKRGHIEIVKRIQFISYDSFDSQVVTKEFKENKHAICGMLAQGYFMEFLDLNFSDINVYRLFQRQKINGKWTELSIEEIVTQLLNA